MRQKTRQPDKNFAVSMLMIAVVVVLFVSAYFKISNIIEERALRRMEEGVNTVIAEVTAKLTRDSRILNAAADIISDADDFGEDTLQDTLESLSPLLETMQMRILLPDNTVVLPHGATADGGDTLSFEAEAALGEHVSDRSTSIVDGDTQILRHFVPVIQNSETKALLYGVTRLEDLPKVMNIDNIYNAKASVFIIDTENGDYIMDTWHEELGNVLQTLPGEAQEATIPETMQGLMSLKTGHLVYKPYGSDAWQYFYYSPAGINQWAIGVSVPKDEAFSSVYDVQRVFWMIAGIMAVAISLYYLWMHINARKATAKAVERAVLEEKLRKAEAAEKAKSTFLSNMSHDIRTPMNAIIGFATLAKTDIDNKERVDHYMENILSSGNYLLSLINDVLDMSRIESGKLNIEENPCSLSEIFRDIRSIILTQMQSKQLNFSVDMADVVNEDIYCDKLHINQVLLNLLSNAIKFTPAGGTVSLTVHQKSGVPAGYGTYEIRVKDTGIGMSPEFIDHIFEPFERERNSTVSGIQGTGLGMAITKNIVDSMGGTIQVLSEKGHGSEFIINLNLRIQSKAEESKAETEMSDLSQSEAVLGGKRLLVVEDNELNREIAAELLTGKGFEVETAEDGTIAVEKVKSAAPAYYDLILMDVQMPLMNGYDATKAIRALEDKAKASIPIVAMTANAFDEDRRNALEAGMNDYVSKPINLEVLLGVLRKQLNK